MHLRVAHVLSRRVRVIAPALVRQPERSYVLEILLRKRQGVHAVRAVAEIGSVTVHFDPRRLPRETLLSALDSVIGNLAAAPVPATPRESAPPSSGGALRQYAAAIEGMTCASCALLVELALRRDPRVELAQVSFGAGTATVRGHLSREEVFEQISRLGYTPRPMDTLAQRRLVVEREKAAVRDAGRRFTSAAAWTLPLLALSMAKPRSPGLRVLQAVLATPVLLANGRPLFERAWSLARRRQANMDTLVAIGAGTAYAYSLEALLRGARHLYFEAAASIVTFVLLGRFLEERARGRAGEAIRALVELQPQTATRVRDGVEEVVTVERLAVGDVLRVRPGERVPTDGVVLDGGSCLDESVVTGESLPVVKQPGDRVTGGCITVAGSFTERVTAVGQDTVLAGIVRMVDEAQGAKLPAQRTADRIVGVFVPAVMGIAGATSVAWLGAGRTLRTALTRGSAVLLIACPCSLGLATPTAIMAASGRAARHGIFIRRGEALEAMAGLTVVVLDKTGTITEGRPAVTDFVSFTRTPEARVLALIAGAEQGSEHYLARALAAFASGQGATPLPATGFSAVPGSGVRATVDGMAVCVGNSAWMVANGVDCRAARESVHALASRGRTPVLAAVGRELAAVLAVGDAPRATSVAAVRHLRELGVRVLMATGDEEAVARRVAAEVGIRDVVARANPDRKLRLIHELRARGEHVGMIGDGVNDAPALAAADVGFAIGTGTQVSIEAASVTLVGSDLAKVGEAIALSRATLRVIRQNLFWALGYNALAIPAAIAGRLSPMVASAAMAASSVSVVTNSLRLTRD